MNAKRKLLRRTAIIVSIVAGVTTETTVRAEQYDLLPLLQVDRSTRPDWQFISPVGGYVRFWIERVQPLERDSPREPGQVRDYGREARSPLSRLFWGRNYSRILQAKLLVTRSTIVSQSVTLAAASHDSSSREGESWRSELGERRFLTPYFRVDQGSTATIEVTLSASRETDSAVTRNILSIIQNGARLVAPTGPLVTALNSDRINQTSNFVDTAISSLFREKVVETSQSDFPAERWFLPPAPMAPAAGGGGPAPDIGVAIAAIRAHFPMEGHVWNGARARDLGEWRVYATEPIVSIFSTVALNGNSSPSNPLVARCRGDDAPPESNPVVRPRRHAGPVARARADHPQAQPRSEQLTGQDLQACVAFTGLVPTRVLSLPVGENVTLGQALRGDSGITSAVQRFQGDATEKDSTTREICNLVAERAEALGLNAYDAAAAVWAFSWNGGLNRGISHQILNSGCATGQLAKRLHLNEVPDSASQTPVVAAPPGVRPEVQVPNSDPQTPPAPQVDPHPVPQ